MFVGEPDYRDPSRGAVRKPIMGKKLPLLAFTTANINVYNVDICEKKETAISC